MEGDLTIESPRDNFKDKYGNTIDTGLYTADNRVFNFTNIGHGRVGLAESRYFWSAYDISTEELIQVPISSSQQFQQTNLRDLVTLITNESKRTSIIIANLQRTRNNLNESLDTRARLETYLRYFIEI